MTDRLEKAIKWARKKHHGSWRDGADPLPYITHPIEVLTILRYEAGVTDEDALIAAVLHDVVEDTDAKLEDLEEKFGSVVRALVQELTRSEPSETETRGLSTDEVRSLRSSMLLADIAEMSPMAQRIKLCDRLSNLRCARATRLGDALSRYSEQTREILAVIGRETAPAVWDQVESLNQRVVAGRA